MARRGEIEKLREERDALKREVGALRLELAMEREDRDFLLSAMADMERRRDGDPERRHQDRR